MRYLLLLILIPVLMFSCSESVPQAELDEEIITQYLLENELTATRHSSGLYYSIDQPGQGSYPDINSKVKVRYTGYLLDGTVFDSGTLDYYLLSSLVAGFQYGLPLFNRGGEGILYIPSSLGYGNKTVGSIPANSILIFEVELIDFYSSYAQ